MPLTSPSSFMNLANAPLFAAAILTEHEHIPAAEILMALTELLEEIVARSMVSQWK